MKTRNNRLKKLRGWGTKRRAVKISGISEQGFRFSVYNKEYYVSRETYAWFLGATDEQIKDVGFCICQSREHGNFGLCWESLDIWLGSYDFDYPDQCCVFQLSNAAREKYHAVKQ